MWELKFYRNSWCAYAKINGQSVRRSLRTADRSIADSRFLDFIERENRPKVTIEEIFYAYMEVKSDTNLKYRWKVLAPHFRNILPDQINERVCKEYIEQRLKVGKKLSSIITELSLLRAAIKKNDRNSKAVFYIPSPPEPRNRHLTRIEAKQLIDSAVAPHIKLFIIMGLTTAARKSAILNLKWDQIDFHRGLINFGKGTANKRRAIVPINMTLERILEEAYQHRTCDYVIENGSMPIKDIKRGFKAAITRAGLINVRPHDLRHTAAVWMAEDRVPMSEIAQYLGHKDSRITEHVYARYSPDYLRTTASALEIEGVQLNPRERYKIGGRHP